ncbi:TPA: site-specific DNA-methyltransferase [Clostridioides difficile]|nr:site-specific DNA-methyltransferase [Clostridioides difficile]
MLKTTRYELYNDECLKIMDTLIEKNVKVDAIIADIPQGITKNNWDKPLAFNAMWDRLYKLRRNKNTPIILFTNQPFTSKLICSNDKHFKIMKYWEKDRPSGFLNAKRMPLKNVEEIAIFYEKPPVYNPQMIVGKPSHSIGKVNGESKCKNNNNYGNFARVEREGNLKYPKQILKYPRPHPPIHPTEKPVPLLKDLIMTYSNEGDVILDFTAGVISTGVAALETNRRFIGIELNEESFNKGVKRMRNTESLIMEGCKHKENKSFRKSKSQ